MGIHVVDIKGAEASKISAVSNTSTSIARKDMSFLDTMKALVSNASAFKLQYDVQFGSSRTENIVDDNKSSNYLPGRSKVTYIRYICFVKVLIKNKTFSV